MEHYKYLILGGGMTADAAVRGIRELDRSGSIGLISAETVGPYDRPPLSKGLWKGKDSTSIWRKTADVAGVELHLGTTATRVDTAKHEVGDDKENTYSYDRLLLAMGGSPRHLPFGGDSIIYYRTWNDYQKLSALTKDRQRFTVIGGGFIGSEIAAALAMNGKQVAMIFPEPGIGALAYPEDLSRAVTQLFRDKGVQVLAGARIAGLEQQDEGLSVRLSGGQTITTDTAIAGIGIEPNTNLAKQAGLEVSNGIEVNEFLQTSASDVFAAGDVARFFNPALNQRMRVEHEDNANTMGQLAGRNMAGATERYTHLPSFYSDLFDLGYEAVGELDPRLEVVSKWKEAYREGIVYYLRAGKVRGVLLWNVWEKVEKARALISSDRSFTNPDLDSAIPF